MNESLINLEVADDSPANETDAQVSETPTEDQPSSEVDLEPSSSDLFGKDVSEITFEDLGADKPLLGKYKTLGDMIDGHKELSKKMREKTPEAPEEYAINLPEDLATVTESLTDDPVLTAMAPVFKKHNLSQEAYDEILSTYLQNTMADQAAELEKLGGADAVILKDVAQFVGKFTPEHQAILQEVGATAEGVKLIKHIKDMTGTQNLPTDIDDFSGESANELMRKAADIKASSSNFTTDTKAQAEYEKLMDDAATIQLKKNQ